MSHIILILVDAVDQIIARTVREYSHIFIEIHIEVTIDVSIHFGGETCVYC